MKNSHNFEYLLRFVIDPDTEERRALADLLRFCREADIDDVALFTAGEEICPGHLTEAEQHRYADMFERIRPELLANGQSMSINPWTSLMHADRGRSLRDGQSFRRMVDVEGNEASTIACPLCPEFRKYYAKQIRRFAATKPNLLWIEDDFRFHNHSPLSWGGCFCDAHMAEYSRRTGEVVTREEFVRGVLQPGEPHRYRMIWLDTCRDTLISFARDLSSAAHDGHADTRLGLMSSDPAIHASEGRDWTKLLYALSGGSRAAHRIHLPSYLERTPQEYLHLFNTVSMLSKASAPGDCPVYPELENFPFSTFTKSLRFTRFQIESALALGIAGITLDLFDILASGVIDEDGHAQNLHAIKPFLEVCNGTGAFSWPRQGVRVLFSPNASYSIHTSNGASFDELYPEERFWAGALGSMGVPFAYLADPDSLNSQTVAVSGQYFRSLSQHQIKALFERNFVLLDGVAAQTLHEMGLGELAGIRSIERVPHDSGVVCYEESIQAEAGYVVPRAASQTFMGDAFLIEYSEGARPITRLMNFEKRAIGAGMTVVHERALIYPCHCEGFTPMVFNRLRQRLLQRELVSAGTRFGVPPMALGGIHLGVYTFSHDDETALYLVNATTDPLPKVRLWAPGLLGKSASIIGADGERRTLETTLEGEISTLNVQLEPMGCAMVTF